MKNSKTNNDLSMKVSKIALRLESLPDKDEVHILDAFGGDGVLWNAVKKLTVKKLTVLSIDKKTYNKIQLKGDSVKFMIAMDLQKFDIIDLDAWGSPDKQLEILFRHGYSGIVHCTFIQTGMGKITHNILNTLGYTKEMIEKIPTIFNRDGLQKFLDYLSLKAVVQVNIVSKKTKNYLWFKLN